MLQPNPYPEGQNGYPKLPKAEALKKSAIGMGHEAKYLDINVTFEDRKKFLSLFKQANFLAPAG